MQNPFSLHFIVPLENQTRAPEFILALILLSLRDFFYTLMATIQCFYGIILQIGLKWNTPLFGQLVRLSALCMPADILLDFMRRC